MRPFYHYYYCKYRIAFGDATFEVLRALLNFNSSVAVMLPLAKTRLLLQVLGLAGKRRDSEMDYVR